MTLKVAIGGGNSKVLARGAHMVRPPSSSPPIPPIIPVTPIPPASRNPLLTFFEFRAERSETDRPFSPASNRSISNFEF
jgi:hypothetical protein